ncbi:MAG: acetate--CoA ligase family protein [Promethearchaeota archaeon]
MKDELRENIETQNNSHFLEDFLNPKSIAIYGANENLLGNMGSQQLLNMIDNGYKGKIYPIHLKLEKVWGLKAYKKIADIPETPDLAIVILPTKIVPQIFHEIGQKGVKNVVLVTAGFRETENSRGEAELKEIAKKYGFRFMGPNCLGFQNIHTKYLKNSNEECILNFTWVNYQTEPGNVSIASQSGTFASHINFLMKERDLNMSKCLSIGNEADIDICDCLEYFEQDPTTEVILLYIEEIKRGRKFFELVKRISPKKPIVALYVGGSEGGARAVSSHTGSMAGNDNIFNGLFEQTGIIRVYSLEELMDVAAALSKLVRIKAIPKGNRITIVTNAGGPGATMADRASRLGLKIPEFSEELQEKLKKFLPHTAQSKQASNPLDYTFSIDPTTFFKRVPEILAKSGEVDAMVCYGAFGPAFFSYQNFGQEVLKKPEIQKLIQLYTQMFEAAVDSAKRIPKKYKFPIFYINPIGYFKDDIIDYLNKKGFLVFRYPHEAVVTMNYIMKYGQFLKKQKKFNSKD